MRAVFCKAYIQTFSLFPENKLKYNSELALSARYMLFEISRPENSFELNEEELKTLYDSLISDRWVKKTLSNYYLLQAFYYSYGTSSDLLKDQSDASMLKAKSFSDSVSPISNDDVWPIYNNIKADIKHMRREIPKLNSERIEKEKLKIIEPVTIKSAHVMFLVSLFSTIFLISGFIYNKLFFASFDLNVGDFFRVSDYIASSVDTLAVTVISSFLGVIFFFWGLSEVLSEELRAVQFETERKGGDYILPVIIVTSTVGLVVHSYKTGGLLSIFLYPLLFFIALVVLDHLPIWKYIKNKAAVGAVLISFFIFSIQLGLKVKDNIKDIKSGEYKSPYTLTLKKEYKKYAEHPFITSNSSYVFLFDSDKGKIVVIPKSGVESFDVR